MRERAKELGWKGVGFMCEYWLQLNYKNTFFKNIQNSTHDQSIQCKSEVVFNLG